MKLQLLIECGAIPEDIEQLTDDVRWVFSELGELCEAELSTIRAGDEDRPAVLVTLDAPIPDKPEGDGLDAWLGTGGGLKKALDGLRKRWNYRTLRVGSSVAMLQAVQYIRNSEGKHLQSVELLDESVFGVGPDRNPLSDMTDWRLEGIYHYVFRVNDTVLAFADICSNLKMGNYFHYRLKESLD